MANLKLIIDEKSIEDQLWVDKYRPQYLKDIIMKQDNINKITQWMTHFKDKKPGYKNSLLLWGPPGTGKTTIANIILKQYGYDVIEFNASDIRNQKLRNKQLNDILGKKNVLDIMMNNPRNIGVIMDELDGLTTGDRGGMNELIKIMYQYRKNKLKKKIHKEEVTPFICISNTVGEKKFNDIKKHSVVIKISEPSVYDQTKLVERIMKAENIEIDGYNIKLLIKESQGDYRRLINMTEEMENQLQIIQQNRTLNVNERVNRLFTEIDNLGNYTSNDWFQSLTHMQFIRLYRTLYDIWIIRGQLGYQVKRSICPFHDPFDGIFPRRFYHETLNTEQIKKACIIVMENLVFSGINLDFRKIGALHALTALTMVSIPARQAMPWLYESIV